MSGTDSAAHFSRLERLLALESEAEVQQALERLRRFSPGEAERSGYALVGLTVAEEHGGLGGRSVFVLAKRGSAPLPWNRLGAGKPVLLSPESGHKGPAWRGVVSELRERQISVALESYPEDLDSEATFRLDLSHDETARQRQKLALATAARVGPKSKLPAEQRLAALRAVLLGEAAPRFRLPEPVEAPELNEAQREAVSFALAAEDVAVIHGPPGTGKTTTVSELIRQATLRGEKVLVTAPSNVAVDNVLEKLVAMGVSAVRLGHPARVLPALREHTLDLLIEDHEDFRLARKLTREAQKLFQQANRYTRAKPEPGAKQAMRQEACALLKDARRLEAQAADRLLDGAEAVCATTTALDPLVLGARRFDLAVIDEACQSTEPGCWPPILRVDRIVLAGDHQQLPPTIVSREAQQAGFGVSLMERLVALYGERTTRRLDVQYRMNKAIMDFSSREFYGGTLVAAPAVAEHRVGSLPPVAFIDTAGAGYEEELEPDGESRLNRGEADLVVALVDDLLKAGLKADAIGIIAPYAAQVRLLRQLASVPGLEIDSVDGFQGREKEAILFSCVRSNQDAEVGFLAEARRLNVAWTRARRRLVVVGDSATLASDPCWQRLLAYIDEIAAYTSVWELRPP